MKSVRRALGWFRNLLASIGFLYIIVTFTPILRWWATLLAGPWEDPKGEILVVLGSETNADIIGESSYWRSVYAVRAWREGWVRHIVVSGAGDTDVPIAIRMKEFLTAQGIPEQAITAETRSSSTRENALFVKPILEGLPGRRILLSSDFHTYRSIRIFRRAGVAIEPRPFPDALKRMNTLSSRWTVFQVLGVETVKIAYYRARGWM